MSESRADSARGGGGEVIERNLVALLGFIYLLDQLCAPLFDLPLFDSPQGRHHPARLFRVACCVCRQSFVLMPAIVVAQQVVELFVRGHVLHVEGPRNLGGDGC